MYKNGTSINIDKISETPGDYKQGVEVCINNIELTVDKITKAIGKLVFFDNLIIHPNNIENNRLKARISSFNNRKIEKFDNFATCNYDYIDNGIYAKVGKVLYKVSECEQIKDHPIFRGYNFIAVECPIGSVSVTPNREQLQYTDKTNQKLKEVFDKSFTELTQMAMELASKNFESIQKAYIFYTGISALKLAERISFNAQEILKFEDLKVNNKRIPQDVWSLIYRLTYDDVPENLICNIFNKGGKRVLKKWITYRKMLENSVAIKCEDRLRNITKSYYCEVVNSSLTYVVKQEDIKDILRHVIYRSCRKNNQLTKIQTLKALSFILQNFKYYKLENDKIPQSYIDSYKDKNKARKRIIKENVEVRSYRQRSYRIVDFKTYMNFYVYKKGNYGSKKKLNNTHMVVYTANTKDDAFIRILEDVFYDKKIKFITLKKEHLYVIPKSKLFISLENFLTLQQKIIAKAATARYLEKLYKTYYDTIDKYSVKFKEQFSDYIYKYSLYTSNEDIIKLLDQYIEKKWLDWAAVIKYSLSDKDIKRLQQRKILDELTNITDSLLYVINGKYVNDDKFGIVPNKKTTLLLKKLLKL